MRSDVGAQKAKVLANALYRAVGTSIKPVTKELTQDNVRTLLKGSPLVIDTFDNHPSRQWVKEHCEKAKIPCLHAGLATDYAEVIWNERYRVPGDVGEDRCDYPLARTLVILTVAVACEAIIAFIAEGSRSSFMITLKDLSITPFV